MEKSSFEPTGFLDLLAVLTVAASLVAALIMVWYLAKAPALDGRTKSLLFLGIFILPVIAAGSGNVVGFEATKSREFCGGCHVMKPWTEDSDNAASETLAAMHSRSKLVGDENCYGCHADYRMFGVALTKLHAMGHVWYYATEYHKYSLEEAVEKIHIAKPFPNSNCLQCHSGTLKGFNEQPDHKGQMADILTGQVSCASKGCHGPAHPFSKKAHAEGGEK